MGEYIKNNEEKKLEDYLKSEDLEHTSKKFLTKFDTLVTDQQVIIICIVTGMIGLLLFKSAFKDGNYTCENFVMNVYIYVLMGLLLMALTTVTILRSYKDENLYSAVKNIGKISKTMLIVYLVGIIILFMILVGGLHYFKYNIIASHLIWLLLIVLFGILFVPLYISLKANNLFMKTLLSTIIVVAIITVFVIYKKDLLNEYLTDNVTNLIYLILLIVIIAKLVTYYIYGFNIKELKDIRVYFAYGLVVIFTYFMLVDTRDVLNITKENCENALKNCVNNNELQLTELCDNYPSYPLKSFDIFLNIINLFQNLATIYSEGE